MIDEKCRIVLRGIKNSLWKYRNIEGVSDILKEIDSILSGDVSVLDIGAVYEMLYEVEDRLVLVSCSLSYNRKYLFDILKEERRNAEIP